MRIVVVLMLTCFAIGCRATGQQSQVQSVVEPVDCVPGDVATHQCGEGETAVSCGDGMVTCELEGCLPKGELTSCSNCLIPTTGYCRNADWVMCAPSGCVDGRVVRCAAGIDHTAQCPGECIKCAEEF